MLDWFKRQVHFVLLTNKAFRFFRWFGVHVTPVHFYSPVPDIREISPAVGEHPLSLVGVEMNPAGHRHLLENIFPIYQPECNFPTTPVDPPYLYHTQNVYFGYISACVMHTLVRHFRPQRIIEVGAGYSTQAIGGAIRQNQQEGYPCELIAIDPYPNQLLQKGFPGLGRLISRKIQEVDLSLLTTLQANDILSIDTSHAVRTGGDVTFLYLELLPRLAPGVLVHIHDIFLPFDYPRKWLEQRYFWNEQYLLHAFLIHNAQFEVFWGQKYAETTFPELFSKAFSGRVSVQDNSNSYSFWLRKIA